MLPSVGLSFINSCDSAWLTKAKAARGYTSVGATHMQQSLIALSNQMCFYCLLVAAAVVCVLS